RSLRLLQEDGPALPVPRQRARAVLPGLPCRPCGVPAGRQAFGGAGGEGGGRGGRPGEFPGTCRVAGGARRARPADRRGADADAPRRGPGAPPRLRPDFRGAEVRSEGASDSPGVRGGPPQGGGVAEGPGPGLRRVPGGGGGGGERRGVRGVEWGGEGGGGQRGQRRRGRGGG
ncbi:hypothetical protein BN946_scf184997.g4, partial [Trametes cinnabarina]